MSRILPWSANARDAAWNDFLVSPLPRRSANAWRYTDPARFIPAERPAFGPTVRRIPEAKLPEGVTVAPLDGLSGEMAETASRLLGRALEPSKLHSLNLASWQEGLFVHVAPGAVPEEPLRLQAVANERPFVSIRLLIVVGEGAALTLEDEYSGGGSGTLDSAVELFAGPASCVRYLAVQNMAEGSVFHLAQRAVAEEEANIHSAICSLGASVFRADLGTILAGRGAESHWAGAIVGSGDQHFDHHTDHLHSAPRTKSDFNFRAILRDRARAVYTGNITIGAGAPGCEAYQEARNLMLSDEARADSIPELEISESDVKCTHGAATGPADPSQLFYLASRGIPEREALRMVAEGFIAPVLSGVPATLRAVLHARLSERLGAL